MILAFQVEMLFEKNLKIRKINKKWWLWHSILKCWSRCPLEKIEKLKKLKNEEIEKLKIKIEKI